MEKHGKLEIKQLGTSFQARLHNKHIALRRIIILTATQRASHLQLSLPSCLDSKLLTDALFNLDAQRIGVQFKQKVTQPLSRLIVQLKMQMIIVFRNSIERSCNS